MTASEAPLAGVRVMRLAMMAHNGEASSAEGATSIVVLGGDLTGGEHA